MKRKRNIKSIVLLAALGIATLFFINISFASTNAKVNVETANLRESAENYKKVKYGSIGVPMDNVDIEFENKDENGIGELKVKGPNVMLGYYENPEATKEVLKNGWFYTGDLGYIDKQGYIFITGRKKDMIVLKNGKKVFPEELEVLINRLEEVKECMVFGMPDNKDKNDVKLTVKVVYDTNIIE